MQEGRVGEAKPLSAEPASDSARQRDDLFMAAQARRKAGDTRGALSLLKRLTDRDPSRAEAWNNLAVILGEQGKLEAAIACLKVALLAVPNAAVLHANLGHYLCRLQRYHEALTCLQRALELEPGQPKFLHFLGVALNHLGDGEAAARCLDQAVEGMPNDTESRWDRAQLLVRNGDFARGFADFDVRLQRAETRLGHFTAPLWHGESLVDRTILVHAEQGFGDVILFVRFLPQLARLGARILFSCPPELMRLLKGFPGIAELVVFGAPMPGPVDFHLPLLSLPDRLRITIDAVGTPGPYIVPPSIMSAPLVPRAPGTKLAVGIVWAGNPAHRNDRKRSMTIEPFLTLCDLPGISLYSLQKGRASDDLSATGADALVSDLGATLNDFADTAAVMMQLDLVVSVDTAAIHLAGALGRPAFVLLPRNADWRWMRHQTSTPWYPTLRLFRQDIPNDWAGVMHRVRAATWERMTIRQRP